MTYDYHGQWDKKTGHVSPMYASDGDIDKTLNTVRVVRHESLKLLTELFRAY